MNAEDVAASLEKVANLWDDFGPSRGGSHERKQAAAIRELIEERDRLRDALKEIAEPTYGTEWTQTDEERAEILGRHLFHKQSLARAALEPRK